MGEPGTKEPLSLEDLGVAGGGMTGRKHVLSILAENQPGVLARIAGVLSGREISIASVIQKEVDGQETAEIVIMTHDAREADVQRALQDIRKLDGVAGVDQMLRVKP